MSSENMSEIKQKFSDLISLLQKTESAVLAFSGGVDSSFLLKAMKISGMRMMAVTAFSETMPEKDFVKSIAFAEETDAEHLLIKTEELTKNAFVSNSPERCFYCKDELFKKIRAVADEKAYIYIFDGNNSDDLHDYRPGRKAADLHGVRSPLAECNFTKKEIRIMSKELGLKTWNQPSSPCLSSRIPYGQRITLPALMRIEKAEEFLRTFGIYDIRVRDHGDTARIEVTEEDMHIFFSSENRRLVVKTLKSLGYSFISLDLEGYKSGSMNRVLEPRGLQIESMKTE